MTIKLPLPVYVLIMLLMSQPTFAEDAPCGRNCSCYKPGYTLTQPDNTLTDYEKSTGWSLLFNGEEVPFQDDDTSFSVENASLVSSVAESALALPKISTDYEIRLDYRTNENTTAHLFLPVGKGHISIVLSNTRKSLAGGLTDGIPPSEKAIKKPMSWNTVKITKTDDYFTVELNNVKTVRTTTEQIQKHMVDIQSDNYCPVLLLESGKVWAKNIKFRTR